LSESVKRKIREKHSIEEWEVYEAFFGRRVTIRNRKERAGSHRLIGRTDSGRILTVPIRESEDKGIWDAKTAWDASKGERKIWNRRAR
jgi:hypothetical protein